MKSERPGIGSRTRAHTWLLPPSTHRICAAPAADGTRYVCPWAISANPPACTAGLYLHGGHPGNEHLAQGSGGHRLDADSPAALVRRHQGRLEREPRVVLEIREVLRRRDEDRIEAHDGESRKIAARVVLAQQDRALESIRWRAAAQARIQRAAGMLLRRGHHLVGRALGDLEQLARLVTFEILPHYGTGPCHSGSVLAVPISSSASRRSCTPLNEHVLGTGHDGHRGGVGLGRVIDHTAIASLPSQCS